MSSSFVFCSAARFSQAVCRTAVGFLRNGTRHTLTGVVCLLVMAFLGLPAHAATVTWKLNAEGFWDIAANWSSGQLPTSADNVMDSLASSTIVHRSGNDTINSFLSQGQFILSGGTLTVLSTLQVNNNFIMYGGTLHSATVNAGSGGQGIILTNNVNNILDGVTVNAKLDLSTGGIARIHNGLVLNGTATLNNGGLLAFEGNQTLSGTSTIVFGATNFNSLTIEGTSTLTLGKNVLVHGQNGLVGGQQFTTGSNALVNNGTITADVSGGTLTVSPNTFTNGGTVEAQNGGNLVLSPSGGTNTGQLLAAGSGSVLNLADSLTNASGGKINATSNGLFQITGNLTNNAGGSLNATGGGQFVLNGSLSNNGTILDNSTGTFKIDGGSISGGTVADSNLLVFSRNSNNSLSGVTLSKGLNLTNGGIVGINNSLTANGGPVQITERCIKNLYSWLELRSFEEGAYQS